MYRVLNVSMPEDLVEEIDGIVEDYGREYRNRSHFIQVAVMDYMDREFPEEEKDDDKKGAGTGK